MRLNFGTHWGAPKKVILFLLGTIRLPRVAQNRRLIVQITRFRGGDNESLSSSFDSTDWQTLFEGKNVDECYKLLQNEYVKGCEAHIPLRSSRVLGRKAPWMNELISAMSRRKKQLWILNRNTKWRVCSLMREYKEIRREIKKVTKTSVRAF